MKESQKFRFKVIIIGDGSVGKTSLIQQFTQRDFQEEYIKTIGAQFSKFDAEIEDDTIRLIFWDIAGQDDFVFLRPTFYRESSAAIIVYSLEENEIGKRSFENIMNWYEDIKEYCGIIPIVVFGNKLDLIDKEKYDSSEINKIINENNFLNYYLTSAKTGKGVHEAFHAIIKQLYSKSKSLASKL
jgi:small GTP-binding protein